MISGGLSDGHASCLLSGDENSSADTMEDIVFMKYGVHAGQSVQTILERKRRDLERFGWFLWGYGGTVCHPTKQVQPFAREVHERGGRLILAMSPTPSALHNAPSLSSRFAVRAGEWQSLPEGMEVYGSRYALVCRDLVECQISIDAHEYIVPVGNNAGRELSKYVRGRVDKACGTKSPSHGTLPGERQTILITLKCEVIEPYAVFLE